MERNHHWYILVALLCASCYAVAQPSFADKTRSFKKNIPTRSVMPGGIADIDGDLVDDLIIIDRGLHMKTVKSSGNIFSLESIDSSRITNNSLWTLTMGDLNNDGINEVITAGEYTRIQITSLNNGQIESTSIDGDFFAQASNTIDINNDGWLDYFVCDDNAPPVIYLNDKNGNLTLTDVIDFTLNDNTDGSGNYGSEWVDVNGDNLPDLCIAKCRAGVDSPYDLRRINRLYINNGDGTFSEKGQEFNLNSGAQTWVTTFGDIDNDGDLDAFVVNHYAPHALMENIDGTHFVEIPLSTSLLSFGFQSIMRDFDNDGYLDIIMSGAEGTTLLHNRGNKTFDIIYNILGPSKAPSLVAGDLNDDGFLDIHAHISIPINEVGVKDDELWINQGNENNFVKINLEGKVSNRSGIAAKIEIYGAWGRQMRYVKGGESYGIFNSFQQHFGLGQHSIIDSLIITWPSSIIDKHVNLDVNKTYFVQEDKCLTATITLYDEIQKFTNSGISLAALDGFESYLWNNGSTTKNITVDTEGTFHVKMTDANGCVTISKPIIVKSGCFADNTNLIDEENSVTLCQGSDFEISSILADKYIWSTGDTTQSISVNTSGWLSLTATDLCGNSLTDQIQLTFIAVDVDAKGDSIKVGERAILTSTSDNTLWFDDINSEIPIDIGNEFTTDILEFSTTFYAQNNAVVDQKIQKVGENQFPLNNFYGSNTINGHLVFHVEQPCIIHSVVVNTDTEGLRKIIIRDFFNEVVFEKEIFLTIGIQTIILDASLRPDVQYKMSTDAATNNTSLGFNSPRLVRSNTNTKYPYVIDNVIQILSSSLGSTYYYYFYDWEVMYDIEYCESEKVPVFVYVDRSSSSIDFNDEDKITIFPNPTSGIITVSTNATKQTYQIKNLSGQTIMEKTLVNGQLDITDIPNGIYLLTIKTNTTKRHFKVVKM